MKKSSSLILDVLCILGVPFTEQGDSECYILILWVIRIDIDCEGASMSPTVFCEQGFRFFFFSREETRMHVHVLSGDGEAKFWIEPEIELSKNYGHSGIQLKQIESIVEAHRDELVNAWKEHFGR